MRRLCAATTLILLIILSGCTKKIYLPSEVITNTETKYKDTTIYIDVPRESVAEITDTLSVLETSYAKARAFVDKKGKLHHALENKQVTIPVKTKVMTITTTIEKKVPYPVVETKKVVPSWCWYLLIIVLLVVVYQVFTKIRALRI